MTDKHYNPELRHLFPANNDNSDVVLNRYFEEWADHIETNIRKRKPGAGGRRYETGKDHELLELCKAHAYEHGKNIESGNVVTLTHPLYTHLTHMRHLTDRTEKDAMQYLSNLVNFLNCDFPGDCVELVVFETVHHYAALTSLLLESGLVDKVIFTEYDGGRLLDAEEIYFLKDKGIFSGGAYNGCCFTSSLSDIAGAVDSKKQVCAISDLIINSPQDHTDTLVPDKLYFGDEQFPNDQIITSDQLIEKFGCGQPAHKSITQKFKNLIRSAGMLGSKARNR